MSFLVLAIFNEPWFIYAVSGAAVVLIIGSILIGFALSRRRMRHQVKELEDRYNNIHDVFSIDCSNMIKRLEDISNHNESYLQVFSSSQDRFGNILNTNDKLCFCALDSLKKLVEDKNYKDLSTIIESTKVTMDEFDVQAKQLNNDLQSILKKEDECRSKAVKLKEKLRNLRAKFEQQSTALSSLSKSFNYLFDHISKLFVDFEEMLSSAKYEEADNILPEIDKLITATNQVIDELPYLNTLADKVVPNKIKELSDSYIQLEKEKYPLHHLLVKTKMEQMNNDVDLCKKKLSQLSISGVKEKLVKITLDVNQLFADFDKEKNAKVLFDKEQNGISNSTYEEEKQFANLSNSLPSYSKVYLINQTYIDQMSVIKDMIDDMSSKKRMLDMYLNSATKQPYTVLLKTMKDLQGKIAKVQKGFDDFHVYLVGLKNDSERAFSYVREAYLVLKKMEYRLRKLDVQALIDVFSEKIKDANFKIMAIENTLKIAPIDVNKVNNMYLDALSFINGISNELNENIDFALKAEDAIVYDNQIRRNSNEIVQQLDVAEKSFVEADFTRAYNQAIQIYKMWGNEGTK